MIFRAFLIVLAFVGSYLVYDSARLFLLKRAIHDVDPAFMSGTADADLTVVEFLDYSCPRCQNTHPSLMAVLEREPSVRYIPRPFSIEDSGQIAARFAYAAGRQGQFMQAHNMLIENYRAIDDAYIDKLAADLKLDGEKIRADMNDPKIMKLITKNQHYNGKLGAVSIPTFFINNRVVWEVRGGGASVQEITRVVDEAKKVTK